MTNGKRRVPKYGITVFERKARRERPPRGKGREGRPAVRGKRGGIHPGRHLVPRRRRHWSAREAINITAARNGKGLRRSRFT
ncbi:hypothetical protein EVAR_22308_1 [Eumeta japonica]|uniref:Uncharacterized protein n=1 Tax=Eumeta variegata TaxID=151549 RepID=A0A4C1UAT2_EUMVA|nr:hypothetical protein EVAR_22308_1 [Eumeta japonica]